MEFKNSLINKGILGSNASNANLVVSLSDIEQKVRLLCGWAVVLGFLPSRHHFHTHSNTVNTVILHCTIKQQELLAQRAAYHDEAGDGYLEEAEGGGHDGGSSSGDSNSDGATPAYNEYRPLKFHLGKPHPDVLVESASLAAVAVPDLTYQLRLPERVIESGVLSAPQLETIAYASQVHLQFLPVSLLQQSISTSNISSNVNNNNVHGTYAIVNGKAKLIGPAPTAAVKKNGSSTTTTSPQPERKGFFLGDGAGVGKGRQLAGVIFENWAQGRRRHLWFSASADLHLDAQRDLADIGASVIDCHKQLTVKKGRIQQSDGVIFSTYNGLISSIGGGGGVGGGARKRQRRLDLLVAWCGGAEHFDGCLMLDECHKAKNLIPSGSSSKPTQMGLAVKEIQERLPKARVVYCSATGCSEPADMAYMTRLGLWGANTSFPGGVDDFRRAFERGGVGMM